MRACSPMTAGLPQGDHCLLLPDERTLPDPDPAWR